jgi:hypothetical protein
MIGLFVVFSNAVWIVKNADTPGRYCQSTGDPHITINPPSADSQRWDPQNVGYFVLTTCGMFQRFCFELSY